MTFHAGDPAHVAEHNRLVAQAAANTSSIADINAATADLITGLAATDANVATNTANVATNTAGLATTNTNLATTNTNLATTNTNLATTNTTVALKATDTAVVHNTGAEAVAGVKTFSSAPVVPTAAFPESAVSGLVTDLATLTTAAAAKVAKGSLLYNVKDYGALGDGTTDDTAAIHTCRDAAGTGGVVYFPAGTFIVKTLLASVNNQTWIAGAQTTIKLNPSNISTDQLFRVTATTGVTVDGGTWDFSTITANRTTMIYTTSCANLTFRNMNVIGVTASDGDWYGLYIASQPGAVIEGCRVVNRGTGIMVQQGTVATVKGPRIARNYVDLSLSGQSTVGGITVTGTTTARWKNVIVSDNQVYGPALTTNNNNGGIAVLFSDGVSVNGNTSDGFCFGYSIVSNTDVAIGDNVARNWCAYGIEAGTTGVTITGNTIDGGIGKGDGIGCTAATAASINITGNTFTNFTSSLAAQRCIFFNSGGTYTGTAIVGNNFVIAGASTRIWQPNCSIDGAVFSANHVEMSSGATTIAILISVAGVNGLTVAGNTFANLVTVIQFNLSSAVTLSNINVSANTLKSVTNLRTSTLSGGAAYGTNVLYQGNNTTARDATVTRVKAGTPSDADFDVAIDGLLVVDTTANKIWARTGGAWKSIAII